MNKIIILFLLTSMQLYTFGQVNPDSARQKSSDTTLQNRPDSSMQMSPDTTIETFTQGEFYGNQEVYKLKAASDIPVIAIGAGWSLHAFYNIYSNDTYS